TRESAVENRPSNAKAVTREAEGGFGASAIATHEFQHANVKTARSWRGIVPFTHSTGIAGCTRRRGCYVAARGARAAARADAAHRRAHRVTASPAPPSAPTKNLLFIRVTIDSG